VIRGAFLLTLSALVLATGFSGGCGDDDTTAPVVVEEGCNPLAADWHCLLPFPTDFFVVPDDSLPGGRRVVLTEQATPYTDEDKSMDFTVPHPTDGFSNLPQILAYFPFAIDTTGLVFHTGDIEQSLASHSSTLLLNAQTGEPVLHFAEIDPREMEEPRRALAIRPIVPLEHDTRYIVAVQGLRTTDGEPVVPGSGFRLLRDGTADDHPVLSQLVEHYENDIFPILSTNGVAREELLLAWDFTTATEAVLTRDMRELRRQLITALQTEPPAVAVDDVSDDHDEHVYRLVYGTLEVPLFTETPEADGARLHRDGDGKVAQNGTTAIRFTAVIPRSVARANDPVRPARFLQYGHGFFGTREEIEGSYVTEFLDRTGMVGVSVDWWGMSTADMGPLVDNLITDTQNTLVFTDRLHQAMANHIAVSYAAKTTLAALPAMEINGELSYDPEHIYFYGISQGHILGGTYVALAPHVSKAVLSVGACAYPFMMFRSSKFWQFIEMLNLVAPDPLDHQIFVTLSGTTFDRVDSLTYAPHVLDDLYPDTPEERAILMHTGIGDSSVPNLASHIHARALGLPLLQPAPREIPALQTTAGPATSAIVEFDFGIEPPLPGDIATPGEIESNQVHEGVRRLDAAITQIDAFLWPDGQITHTCAGPCDPE
jgi:hypothetical protein